MLPDTSSKTVTTPKDFLQKHKESLRKFIVEELDDPIRSARTAQLLRAKRAAYYWAGKQYGSVQYKNGGYDWVPLDMSAYTSETRVFANVYNIVRSDGQKFKAAIGQRRFNILAVCEQPDDPDSAEGTRKAESMAKYLMRYWKLQQRMADEVAQVLWETGPVFGYVDYVIDGVKHGYHTEDVYKQEDVQAPGEVICPACGGASPEGSQFCQSCGGSLVEGIPQPGPMLKQTVKAGEQRYAKGMVELYLLDCLHVTVPFEPKRIDEHLEWLDHSIVIGKNKARCIIERLLGVNDEEAMNADENDENAEEAQRIIDEVVNPNDEETDRDQDQRVYSRRWLNRAAYDNMSLGMRRQVKDLFPRGCLIHRMGGQPFLAEEKLLEEHWSVCRSGVNKAMASPGIVDSIIAQQDSFNNHMNVTDETMMRGLPLTIVDSQVVSKSALMREARVAEIILTRTPGVDLSKATRTIEPAKLPEGIMNVQAGIRDFSREADGISPQIWGGADPSPTWRQDQQAKAGAMQQLQLPFENQQEFVVDVMTDAVRLCARHGLGEIVNPPTRFGDVSQTIDMRDIPEEGWHIEASETAPQTMVEKANKLLSIGQENPDLATAIGMNEPMNAGALQAIFGVEGFYAPGQYEFERVLRLIEQLLHEPPQMMPDPMTGMPVEQASVPPDPFIDKPHDVIANMIRAWCKSPAGQAASKNPKLFFKNVVLHGQAQDQAAMQDMMQQAPPAPAPGGKGAPAGQKALPPAPGNQPGNLPGPM